MTAFAMGTLDHMHLVVPDREEAAAWFEANLGFERVEEYEPWARVDGGPLHISADRGKSGLALFNAGGGHQPTKFKTGIAFRVKSKAFLQFVRALPESEILGLNGKPLTAEQVVDLDLCFSIDFQDPWGNPFELNCYDYATLQRELVEKDGLTPVRYW